MTPSRALPALLPAAGLLAVWLVRPGVVENAARSPLAWAVTAGGVAAAVGLRAAATRLGASVVVARGLSTALVLALLAVVLAPSFRQRTLVEDLPADLLAGPAAPGPGSVAGPVAPVAAAPSATAPSATGTSTSPAAPAAVATTAAPRPVRTTAVPQAAPRSATTTAPARAPSTGAATQAAPARAVDRTGSLEGIGHTASGTVHLRSSDGVAYVVFEDVNIEGSVDPSVHLVPEGRRTPGGGGVRLGALKAEKGTFSYRLPSSVDLTRAWSVLVWCDPYDTPIAASDPR